MDKELRKQILKDVNKIVDCKLEQFAANMYIESLKSTLQYVENKEQVNQKIQETKQHIMELDNKLIRIINDENES